MKTVYLAGRWLALNSTHCRFFAYRLAYHVVKMALRAKSTLHKQSITVPALVATMAGVLMIPPVATASQGSDWISAGGNRQNTRHQQAEHTLSVENVNGLIQKWVLQTGGDVSATPAVDADTVYVPDWAGNLYAVDKLTGAVRWQVSIAEVTGLPGDKARATPAVTEDKVIIGTQGPFGNGGKILAFDKFTGQTLWSTQADSHPAAIITQSATVFDGRVYVGVSSQEEALAAFIPGYVLSFRGSMLALDLETGAILWKTYMAPQGYTGNAVWGSSPAIDTRRGQVYIATGNNYSVPDDVLDCVAAAGGDPVAKSACLPADNHFDSILALDMKTGAIRWATRATPYDAWTLDCVPFLGDGSLCPDPAGPGYDFAQAPALFRIKGTMGKPLDVVGAGQKSGQYWTLDADTGAVRWVTQAGPGGSKGGLQWGSAVDGQRIYTANANSDLEDWTLPDGSTTTNGVWSAMDTSSGELLWQVTPSWGGSTSGPVTTANGVVFGCSLDPEGHMYALNGATGEELWSFASGGSCLSGAAISDGMLFWGSGYSNFGLGTSNNKLYAFGLPD
ncbi:PQQ-binding-like beta-propeller repeat protein [Marinobacterium rhizophilum]|uniref:outer membrane protein assembly factor BamB family protein n=1 Tax=Marinobacterium rhizophilum TaxID=420402 RepID=UPI0003A02DC3|nr:PQQ-binding-like beta-propeller repeat protein [Marinobacterium rhizophilum]